MRATQHTFQRKDVKVMILVNVPVPAEALPASSEIKSSQLLPEAQRLSVLALRSPMGLSLFLVTVIVPYGPLPNYSETDIKSVMFIYTPFLSK